MYISNLFGINVMEMNVFETVILKNQFFRILPKYKFFKIPVYTNIGLHFVGSLYKYRMPYIKYL